MEKRELTCIGCPMGCSVTVEMNGGQITEITGNTCPVGDTYARKEITDPTRIVTSTVILEGSSKTRLPVKTATDIKKADLFRVMDAIHHARITAPVKSGDVVIDNVAGSGVSVIATASADAR